MTAPIDDDGLEVGGVAEVEVAARGAVEGIAAAVARIVSEGGEVFAIAYVVDGRLRLSTSAGPEALRKAAAGLVKAAAALEREKPGPPAVGWCAKCGAIRSLGESHLAGCDGATKG